MKKQPKGARRSRNGQSHGVGGRRALGLAAIVASAYVTVPAASAAVRNYVGPDGGNWGTAASWSPSGAPATGDDAMLTPADGISRAVNYANGNSAIQLGTVRLAGTNGAVLTLKQSKDFLTAHSFEVGNLSGAAAVYELSGGTATIDQVTIGTDFYYGGSGRVIQTGGLLQARVTTLEMASGTNAVYAQSGGTFSVSESLSLGNFYKNAGPKYAISGTAVLQSPHWTNIGNGGCATVDQSGGQTSYGQLKIGSGRGYGTTTYSLSGGTLTATTLELGGYDTSEFVQTGGTVTATAALNVANVGPEKQGTYRLSGAAATVDVTGPTFVGGGAPGKFVQTGGTHATARLEIGTNGIWGRGAYELSDGALTVRGDESLDVADFVQTGGTHTVAGKLSVGVSVNSIAFFTHSGGTTSTGQVLVGGGNQSARGRLTISGGTFHGGSKLTLTSSYHYLDVTGGSFDVAATQNDGTYTQTGGQASLGDVTGTYGKISVSGGTLTTGSIVQTSLTLTAAADVRLGSGTAASKLDILSVAPTASLDLAGGRMVINYSGDFTYSPIADVRDLLARGFAAGAWNGAGLRSSAAAGVPGSAIGYAEAAVLLGLAGTKTASWSGRSVDASSVLIRWTRLGDANLDGGVNFNDLLVLAKNYDGSGKTWTEGDFNYDGTVNFADLLSLAKNYNTALPIDPLPGAPADFAQDLAAAFAAVPEPSTAALGITACGFKFLARRRRSCRA